MSWTVLVFAFGLALGLLLLRRKMRRAWFGVVIITAAIPLTALLGIFPAHLFGDNAALVAALVVAPFPMLAGLLSGWLTAWILRRAGS